MQGWVSGPPIATWKNMSVHQCAEKCDEEIRCKSFEYCKKQCVSNGPKQCKLTHSYYPTDPNPQKYRQWYFCQQEGKKSFMHDLSYTKRNQHLCS